MALGFDATLPLEQLRPLFRAVNDELASVVARYPGRFLAVAALPAADPVWAAQELRRAHQELGLIGGALPLNAFATLVPAAHKAGVADPLARLRRLYLDPGPHSRNGEWVKLAISKLGADRILFGTDYGVGGGDRGDSGRGLATLDKVLTPQQRQQIYIDNSRQLLARKGIKV